MTVLTSGSLSRVVPAHRKTIKFNWCNPDFMLFGFYRKVREDRHKPMTVQRACFWCRTAFKDEDMMGLAQPESGKNQLLCQPCVRELSAATTTK